MKCAISLLMLFVVVGALAALDIFSANSISALAQEQEDEVMGMDRGEVEEEVGGRDPTSYTTEYIGIFAIGASFGLLIAPLIIRRNTESIPELKIRNKVFIFISVIAWTIAVGIIHILLIKEHMEESYIWGIGFLVMGILQLMYGGVFITLIKTQGKLKRRRMVLVSFYSLGIIGNILLVAIFTYARLFVPPFSPEGVPVNELEVNGILTVIIELLITGLLVYLLQEERGEKKSIINKHTR